MRPAVPVCARPGAVPPALYRLAGDVVEPSLDRSAVRIACTRSVAPCTLRSMANGQRLNITLDDERATKLARLAARVHVNEGTLARSMLSTAIDDADPDAASVTAVLDGIPGAFERAEAGRRDSRNGATVPLDQL